MSEKKLPISVVLLTRNEENNIQACLDSCAFVQEVIVIDDGSTDQTMQIASTLGAKIFQRPMNGDWGAQQTFGIQKATQPWIFLLDADERVTPQLRESLEKAVSEKGQDISYEIQRENHFVSGTASHGVVRPDWVLRLLPRQGAGVVGQVHPTIITPFKKQRLNGRLIHYPYSSWDSYFRKFDKYTKLAAEKYQTEGRDCRFFRDIVLRPIWAFFKVYFINRGFLDGKLGFIFSVNHYFYTLAKYVRFYYLKNYGGKI